MQLLLDLLAQSIHAYSQEEVEDKYDSTRKVKMNILWKKMMTMIPLHL